MSEQSSAQIYLITPPSAELSFYKQVLSPILDSQEIACLRLGLTTQDESTISRHADALREVGHARDISVLINEHYRMVTPLGLDGVHRVDAAKSIRDIRDELPEDAIIGTHCGTSKHAGMTAGEIGADYVCFGPLSVGNLGDGNTVSLDVFEWWSDFVEVPIVAEGGITLDMTEKFAPFSDFIALGPELWEHSDDPKATLAEFVTRLK